MSTSMWKLERDLCRCCHAEGSFKNLSEPCYQLGQEEIYLDMLHESLDIKIIPLTGVLSDITYTICDSCIMRLRDASNFKRQVLDCEEKFKDMYSRNLIACEVKVEPTVSDSEEVKVEFQSMDDDDDDDEAFLKYHDDMVSTAVSTAEVPKTRGRPKSKAKAKTKPTPKKRVKKSTKEEESETTEPAASGEKKKDLPFKLKLEEYPFIITIEDQDTKKYHCEICNTTLRTINILKQHVFSQHTTIQCPVCDKTVIVSDKPRHLSREHNVEEVGSGKNKILKVKSTYECDICQEKYTRKRDIWMHISREHNLEGVSSERNKILKARSLYGCDICKKKYTTKQAMRLHLKAYHTFSKCPDCPSKFTERAMLTHRNEVHGTPMPTCGICGYKNAKEARVLVHQRQVHMKEKNVTCNVCDATFFKKFDLRRHMITHNPKKIHECSYCHKKFPRKRAQQLHEKIHTGEKNKVCAVCGKRFVQKASLNYHMGKHHPDAC